VTEADVWRSLIPVLRSGLDSNGHADVKIRQSFQPRAQGASLDDSIYLFKVAARRYASQGRSAEYSVANDNFDVTDNYWIEATFQLTATIQRDVKDSASLTAYDIAEKCSAILQASAARQSLLDSRIGILRITDIRNPIEINDYDQYEQFPSFDFILTYNQTIASTAPATTTVNSAAHNI